TRWRLLSGSRLRGSSWPCPATAPTTLRHLRPGIHGHSHVSLRKCRSVVGAVAGHGHELPLSLLPLNKRHLVFGLGFSKEIVDSRLASDSSGGQRIVPRDHHGTNAHGAKMIE